MLKIHSKFQDYYDSAIDSFPDSDVIINRKEKIYKKEELVKIIPKEIIDNKSFNYTWYIKDKRNIYHYDISAIGFCGKWYYFRIYINNYGKECLDYLTFEEINKNSSLINILLYKNFAKYLAKFTEIIDLNTIEYFQKDIFEQFGPILYIPKVRFEYLRNINYKYNTEFEIISYPKLKKYKFQIIKDSFTALYEIEHWYDSHARPDEAIVPVGDDITRLQAYGFDKKTSFRKMKKK